MVACFAVFYTMICIKSFYSSLSTLSPPLNNPKTTSFISMTNYSPLSSERGWGRGLIPLSPFHEGAGGEALFPPFHPPNKKERSGMKMLDLLLYL